MITFVSCDSNEHELEVNITNPVNIEENAMVNCILENILNEVEYNLLTVPQENQAKQDSLPLIKVSFTDNSKFAQSITIDYGTENSPDYLGKLKRGKIISSISGEFLSEQCCLHIEFDDFYINNLNISGLIEVNSEGFNADNKLSFEVLYNEIEFADQNGNLYSVSGQINREWIAGMETPLNPWDDQFFTSGTCEGQNSEDRQFKTEILTPLLISRACEFIPSGEIVFTVENDQTTYNYGDGLCDNKGVYIKDNKQLTFEFGRYEFRYQKY